MPEVRIGLAQQKPIRIARTAKPVHHHHLTHHRHLRSKVQMGPARPADKRTTILRLYHPIIDNPWLKRGSRLTKVPPVATLVVPYAHIARSS